MKDWYTKNLPPEEAKADQAVIDAELAKEEVRHVELPEETREEINERINDNWALLQKLGATPDLEVPGYKVYTVSPDTDDATAREFADWLSRLVLKSERKKR